MIGMKLYERSAGTMAAQLRCGAVVERTGRQCACRVALLFVEESGAIKAASCNRHSAGIRAALTQEAGSTGGGGGSHD